MVTMVTMGDDLQPGCFVDRLLTGLGQPQINPYSKVRLHRYICLWGASVQHTRYDTGVFQTNGHGHRLFPRTRTIFHH